MIKRRFGVSFRELGTTLSVHSANFGTTQLTFVRPQEPTKLDGSNNFPFLYRQLNPLLPIVMTKLFGYDRGQSIFVLEENRRIIEQLQYRRSWRWTDRFCRLGMLYHLGDSSLRMTSGMIVVSIGLS